MIDVSRGGYWIGFPGSLVPLGDNVGAVGVDHDDEPRITRYMGGGRSISVSRNRAPRTWSVTIPEAQVDDISPLQTLLTATMGPYVWVTPYAQVTNVLTPEQSVLNATSPQIALGGQYPIAAASGGGWATISRPNPSAAGGQTGIVRISSVPIPPMWTYRPVTVSAYLGTSRAAGAFVFLRWLDTTGKQVGTDIVGNYVTGLDGLRRSVATGTPAWGAMTCQLGIYYAEVIAQPAVTWTDRAMKWGIGQSAQRVHVHGLSESIGEWAVADDQDLIRQDVSFTVSEAGPGA